MPIIGSSSKLSKTADVLERMLEIARELEDIGTHMLHMHAAHFPIQSSDPVQEIVSMLRCAYPPKIVSVNADTFEQLLNAGLVDHRYLTPYFKGSRTVLLVESP